MRVFTVPPSAPFLRTVIAALVDGRLIEGFEPRRDPERLADVTLCLPTRRAGRLARDIFLDVLGAGAAILPRIVALGAVDEDELDFAQIEMAESSAALDIPPALDGLERRLTLAQLVAAWARRLSPDDPAAAPLVASGPASALALADDLARLMDDMVTRGVPWSALDGLVPDELDRYWQLTLGFLRIAREAWPALLAAQGCIEPAARRDRLIAAEAARLAATARGPVIAAGSTGSMPATAAFLAAVARLPQGAVVLPGLDTDLDEAAWQAIGGARDRDGRVTAPPVWSHPQFALHGLLARIGLARGDVVALADPAPHGRETLASEALRPAAMSGDWHARLAEPARAARIAAGVARLAVIEAANPEMEALAIAVALREARERNLTAALVTPDRALARRVAAACARWDLDIDDSGGDALTDSPAGLFACLAAASAAEALAPPALLGLLKHPLLRLGAPASGHRRAIAALELAVLRGPRPAAGTAGLAREFATFRDELRKLRQGEASALHRSEPRAALIEPECDAAQDLIARLTAALAPFETIDRKPRDLLDLAQRHRTALERLATDDAGIVAAYEGADGAALAAAFDDLLALDAPSGLAVTLGDYPEVFRAVFADRILRQPHPGAATLRIYGPLEARLTECDRVILGGLVEGVWPPGARGDPWLSRPMRHQLGLDLPERRIGLSAHDFAQLLGAPEVILTHAAKIGGAPAVASRFLHRLEAVMGAGRWRAAKEAGGSYLRHAAALDHPDHVAPATQPVPRPALALRPQQLSVTEIEDWLRDPYTIYARHILRLRPLDPVDMPPTAADRGSAIHEALGEFTRRYAAALPPDAEARLRAIGETHFAPLMARPEARALWWPRFLRIAAWFAGWETARRAELHRVDAETFGRIVIPLARGRAFTLTTRADRIEHRADGSFALLDYKTGNVPSDKQVYLGLSPQLTLEAAILRGGGFEGIAPGACVAALAYVRLTGNDPPGRECTVALRLKPSDPPQPPDEAADAALRELTALVRRYEDEAQGYPSLDLPMWSGRYGRYDNLARTKEWSARGGPGGEE